MPLFEPNVTTHLRNCDMSKMHDVFLAWVENVFPEVTEKQKTQIMCHAIRVYWMMENWDLMPPQKKEDPEKEAAPVGDAQ
ncbi:MAG: hypothetical protein M0Q91_16395 [Methanoregula sp.]|nr:hypothetical protein [Methanoregula sp.]